ncbi:MAG: serine hydrolase [Candidatus Moraniibacteriota bacterium]
MFGKYQNIIIPIATFFLGGVFLWAWNVDSVGNKENSVCGKQYPFLDAKIDCIKSDEASDQIESSRKAVEKIVNDEISAHRIDRASVFYRDLNTRRWFGVNDTTEYYPGSLVKLPVSMGYYKLSELQPELLNKKIVIPVEDVVSGNTDQHYPPQDPLVADTPYTVAEMIRHMIVYSDNAPFGPLMDHGRGFVEKSLTDLGLTEMREGEMITGWRTSVRTYAGALRALYSASYLNMENSNAILSLLSQSTFMKGIVSGVPSGIKVSHKFGEGTGTTVDNTVLTYTLNDCGIVYKPGHPFILCVMTESQDFTQMETVIQEISRASYSDIQ